MEAKEYLQRIEIIDEVIKGKRREVEQLGGKRYKVTQTLKPVVVSGGGSNGGFTDASDRIIDLEKEIAAEKAHRDALKREACALLAELKNKNHYRVLHRHYILFESFEQIAVELGCTYRWACILHGRALQAFQKVLDAHELTEGKR